MAPVRRNGLQRFQDKAALGDARMGKDNRPVHNRTGIIQQINIQASRCIGGGTLTSKGRFDFMQKCQQRKGMKRSSNRGDGVQELWCGRIGPSLGFVEGRDRGDLGSCPGQRRQSRIERFGGWAHR